MATIITHNPENSNDQKIVNISKLSTMQKIVGGYIEIIYLKDNYILIVNEEGRLRNLPINNYASFLAQRDILGDVIYCKSKELN
tara:strand:+ start:1754 stop:2005 length:252 start_codon:yes stop_codon:yes gene_type:complete